MSSQSSIPEESNFPVSEYRCWAEVDPRAIRENLKAIRSRWGGLGVMAVVKANAYGHGMEHVVGAVHGMAEMFGVANLAEAREVARLLGVARGGGQASYPEIYLLGSALPSEREAIVREGYTIGVSSAEEAASLAQWGHAAVHLCVDSGMGRMGVWQEDAMETLRLIASMPGVSLRGICSHLPVADEDEAFTASQLEQFERLAREAKLAVPGIDVVHVGNSAGLLRFSDKCGDLVRAGLVLYGVSPNGDEKEGDSATKGAKGEEGAKSEWLQLHPALSWKSRVILVRDFGVGRSISYGRTFITDREMRVATVAAGYADGYPRQMSGKGASVLIGGKRCRVLGRITMDQVMADVSGVSGVSCGDEVVLLGSQGEEKISAWEVSKWAGTIPWDILTGIGRRVERVAK